jgi:hypothetical protein
MSIFPKFLSSAIHTSFVCILKGPCSSLLKEVSTCSSIFYKVDFTFIVSIAQIGLISSNFVSLFEITLSFFFFFVCLCLWYWGLNPGPPECWIITLWLSYISYFLFFNPSFLTSPELQVFKNLFVFLLYQFINY